MTPDTALEDLTASAQNYLKAIWSLQEWSEEPVTASDIAERTGLRVSTVSGGISKLREQGFVHHTRYGSIDLTAEGHQVAVAMVRRHRLLETFLVRTLGYSWDQVHEEAEHLEHVVSAFFVEQMDAVLGHPDRDPHGDPIPAADGTVTVPPAIPLVEVEAPARVRIERISDTDEELLRFFAERGVGIGSELQVTAGAPYSESIHLLPTGGEDIPLGCTAARHVWVCLR
ncbi:MAG: metal-dependent transcriptional regulator [Brachybacterium sp.]|nr:metal-dependent transcriptional regulator [Brachybacterium sp.]